MASGCGGQHLTSAAQDLFSWCSGRGWPVSQAAKAASRVLAAGWASEGSFRGAERKQGLQCLSGPGFRFQEVISHSNILPPSASVPGQGNCFFSPINMVQQGEEKDGARHEKKREDYQVPVYLQSDNIPRKGKIGEKLARPGLESSP